MTFYVLVTKIDTFGSDSNKIENLYIKETKA